VRTPAETTWVSSSCSPGPRHRHLHPDPAGDRALHPGWGVREHPDPQSQVYRGVGAMTYYVPASIGLVIATMGLIGLPVHLAGYHERACCAASGPRDAAVERARRPGRRHLRRQHPRHRGSGVPGVRKAMLVLAAPKSCSVSPRSRSSAVTGNSSPRRPGGQARDAQVDEDLLTEQSEGGEDNSGHHDLLPGGRRRSPRWRRRYGQGPAEAVPLCSTAWATPEGSCR
jgi:hypothetical protein